MSTDSEPTRGRKLRTVVDLEEPEADVIEQHLPADPAAEPEHDADGEPVPGEADPGDAVEQRRPVGLDEEYPPSP